MPLAIGDKLGPYEIVSLIGKGGMGEVYRAHDSRLNRDVAVKVAGAQFSERFAREARSIAALNHTNICHLYDVGPDYLVMEFVEGQELRGPLGFDEALPLIQQLIDGIEAAHERNIVHRDLKPVNIKVTPEGTLKILDFGLAKVTEPPPSSGTSPEDSPTFTMGATVAGTILGTAGYMAPEQAKGVAADRRSDIWAFGVVVYELLTGNRLFAGDSAIEILASVLNKDVDLSAAPPRARSLLRWCLEKDRKRRLASITDARRVLTGEPADEPVARPAARARTPRIAWALAGLALASALAVSAIHFREKPPETPAVRTTILPPENTDSDYTNGLGLSALSPDGKRLVFGARTSDGKNPLWVRPLDGLTAQPLAGTDGATFPFWSPDSRYIAFFADGRLKKIDASGGPTIALADAPFARGGSWSSAGVIVFTPTNSEGLVKVSSAGGPVTPLPGTKGRLPWFLPDGEHYLFQPVGAGGGNAVEVRLGSLAGAADRLVLEASSNALYAQGNLLYLRDGTLMAKPFDAKRLVAAGEETPVAEDVRSVLNTQTAGVFTVSATGLLLYGDRAGQQLRTLVWFDRSGKAGKTIGPPMKIRSFRLSPDRKSLAAAVGDRSGNSIWIYDLARGVPTRLTTETVGSRTPVWSPDGKTVAFASNRKGHNDLYLRASNGSGADDLIFADGTEKIPTSWSSDGKFLELLAKLRETANG
jgi:serine/threonine protein kinase